MLLETAYVVAVQSHSVWVETIRRSSCGSCVAQSGCGHGLLQKLASGRRNYIEVFSGSLAAADCTVDDQVRISIPEKVILQGSFLVYILPMLTMLGGAALATGMIQGSQDLSAVAGAAGGFLLGVAVVRWRAWHHRSNRPMQPSLVALLNSSAENIRVS